MLGSASRRHLLRRPLCLLLRIAVREPRRRGCVCAGHRHRMGVVGAAGTSVVTLPPTPWLEEREGGTGGADVTRERDALAGATCWAGPTRQSRRRCGGRGLESSGRSRCAAEAVEHRRQLPPRLRTGCPAGCLGALRRSGARPTSGRGMPCAAPSTRTARSGAWTTRRPRMDRWDGLDFVVDGEGGPWARPTSDAPRNGEWQLCD